MKRDSIEKALSTLLGSLGKLVGENPIISIVVPIVISAILSTAFFIVIYERNSEYLYTPTNSPNTKIGNFIQNKFPNDVSGHFDPGRMTKFGQLAWIIITSDDGGSILRTPYLKQVLKVNEYVYNITITDDDVKLTYRDICSSIYGKCFENPIIRVAKMVNQTHDGTDFVKYPVEFNFKDFTFDPYFVSLGGVITDDENNVIEAKAVRLVYFLDYSTAKMTKIAQKWENRFIETFLAQKFNKLTVTLLTAVSVDNEIEKIIHDNFILIAVAIVFMVTFAILTTASTDWTESTPWIGLFASVCCGLALLTGFGICIYCGASYIHINITIGFLMLGVGMDDSFVILSAWRRSSRSQSIPNRLGEAYMETAVSITITSLTNLLSFLLGVITPFPFIRIFCLYTVVTIFVMYIYQLIFVGGCLALCGRAEKDNRHSFTFLRMPSESSPYNTNRFFKLFCTVKKHKENGDHFLMNFFKNTIGDFLTLKLTKIGVIIIFIVYLSIAVFGCTTLKEDTDLKTLIPQNSYVTHFLKNFEEHFSRYRDRIQIIVDTKLDYSDKKVQNDIEKLLQTYEESVYIGESTLTESWLKYYLIFLEDPRTQPIVSNYNTSSKEGFLILLRRLFLKHPVAKRFKDDVVFNDNYTEIIRSRFFIQTNYTTIDYRQKSMLQELRSLAKRAPFHVEIYSPTFSVIDFLFVIVPISIQVISLAVVIMIAVCLALIPNTISVIWIAISLISIETGVVGYMALWNVGLATNSMLTLLICVGLSVDYSAHISYAYVKAKGETPNEKLKESLYAIGMPIFQAAVSTFIAILFFNFIRVNFFFIFFKILLLIIIIASVHGIVFLPVFLSLTEELLNLAKGKDGIFNCGRKRKDKTILSETNGNENHTEINLAYKHEEETKNV